LKEQNKQAGLYRGIG